METKEKVAKVDFDKIAIAIVLNGVKEQDCLNDEYSAYVRYAFRVKRNDAVLKVIHCPFLNFPDTSGYQVVFEYKGHEMTRSYPSKINSIFEGYLRKGISSLIDFSRDNARFMPSEIEFICNPK